MNMLESTGLTPYEYRFSGISRLIGKSGFSSLKEAHILIVGAGGVGSWAVEALARSGVGHFTLVDPDEVCLSNTNRQLHALLPDIGQLKIELLKKRVLMINPECKVDTIPEFYTKESSSFILAHKYSYVIDAIDSLQYKCHLIASCRDLGIPVITIGASGGRFDPTKIQVADLGEAYNDKLLMRLRKKLRNDYGFAEGKNIFFNVDCVFSSERAHYPTLDGEICETKQANSNLKLDCESGLGTATFVTGTFGFVAAYRILSKFK
ncbi:MAG: tRNA threonylcarbamoyladenosine dehydratase [Bacteriovoracaceae bacterium]